MARGEDRLTVKAFGDFLEREYRLKRYYPEDHPKDTSNTDCELTGPEVNVVVEHTTLEVFGHEKHDDDKFLQVLAPLEEECRPYVSGDVSLSIECGVIDAGRAGRDQIRQSLSKWLGSILPTLDDGHHSYDGISGVPFPVRLAKWGETPRRFHVVRDAPDLCLSLQAALEHGGKLLHDTYTNWRRILLLESKNVALISAGMVKTELHDVLEESQTMRGVDVYFAHSSGPGNWDFERIWQAQPSRT